MPIPFKAKWKEQWKFSLEKNCAYRLFPHWCRCTRIAKISFILILMKNINAKYLYNINSLLPHDISAMNLFPVAPDAHCRYDALSREYKYFIYHKKNPFLFDTAYFYPYKINIDLLNGLADLVLRYNDFTSFSKKKHAGKKFLVPYYTRTMVLRKRLSCFSHNRKSFFCAAWCADLLPQCYYPHAAAMLLKKFIKIIESKNCANADFSAPAKGLFFSAG